MNPVQREVDRIQRRIQMGQLRPQHLNQLRRLVPLSGDDIMVLAEEGRLNELLPTESPAEVGGIARSSNVSAPRQKKVRKSDLYAAITQLQAALDTFASALALADLTPDDPDEPTP